MKAKENFSGGFNVVLGEEENSGMLPKKARDYLRKRCKLVKVIMVYQDDEKREFTVTQWAQRDVAARPNSIKTAAPSAESINNAQKPIKPANAA